MRFNLCLSNKIRRKVRIKNLYLERMLLKLLSNMGSEVKFIRINRLGKITFHLEIMRILYTFMEGS